MKNDQNDLAKRLLANAKDGSEIINEAAKNPIFDSQTLSEFASSLSTIKKISSGPMLESEKNLDFAARHQINQKQVSQLCYLLNHNNKLWKN